MAQAKLNRDGIRYLLTPFIWAIIMAAAFLLAAGRLNIFRGWLAFGVHFLGAIGGMLIMWRFAPGLANQRAAAREGTKKWDKAILLIYFLLILIAIPIAAGLDVGRYGWSQLTGSYAIVGIILYVAYFFLFYWSILVNRHFEGTSRIQHDRGHQVISQGPYSFVRHPGYVAMIFASLSDPFIIGSLYSFIPSLAAIIAAVIRTFLEDKMLQKELEGYSEYAQNTRYRLVPGLW